ncbi:hypothetical protein FLK61_25475 [Paenalkalicoccus suaedae]|uniref:Uncharacterized protein n=1 Tax=Paenalkalicoccus suaedae TaxID=2592382 RepID=A0A859FK51_9BACI|nr:hypothetical protein FLK61_25475 [Paenalkalicoccus suaedae]
MNTHHLLEDVTARIYERDPSLVEKYGEAGKQKCYEDNQHHLKQLHAAYTIDDATMFVDYSVWLDEILRKHGMSTQHLVDNFEILIESLTQNSVGFELPRANAYRSYLLEAIARLERE